MRRNEAKTLRGSRNQNIINRLRLRPSVFQLEERQLLSTIIVNNPTDTPVAGQIDLRQAIDQANSASDDSTITFDPTVFATPKAITLGGSLFELSNTTGSETITGPAAGLTIDGNNASRVFQIDGGVTASISGTTITGSLTPAHSYNYGAVTNNGNLTLTGCSITGNSSTYGGAGGLLNTGTANLTDCTISNNSCSYYGYGGLFNNHGTVMLTNCTISGNSVNHGTAGLDSLGTATLTNCTISNNSATYGRAGGLLSYGTLTLTGCTISDNFGYYNGGVEAGGDVTITGCTFSGNGGQNAPGAVELSGATLTNCTISNNASSVGLDLHATDTLTDCTISGNSGPGVSGGYSLTMSNCTISGNSGGGLASYGTTTLTDCTISGNSGYRGGGILQYESTATLTMSNCTISGNSANRDGGGLEVDRGTATLTNCNLRGNSTDGDGGGLKLGSQYSGGATATLTNCTVSGNSANGNGGGVEVFGPYGGVTATLTNCTISGNSTGGDGGGLNSYRVTATLTDCTVSGNSAGGHGGGILTIGDISLANCTISANSSNHNGGGVATGFGGATLTDCTLSGNSAPNGGAVYNILGTLKLTDCTVSGNSTNGNGGGLFNLSATATLTNSTVSGNTASNGGGLYDSNSSTATLVNTIIAANSGAAGVGDIAGVSTVSGNNNLIGTGGSGGLVNGVNGNLVGVANPGLAPLGDYGGLTKTMPLLPGSLAIDAGTGSGAPTTDQRGFGRVGAVDIGAFESQGFTFTPVAGSTPQSTVFGSAFANPLAVSVMANNSIEPLNGGVVTFTSPGSGASATLSATTVVISGGKASVTATANGVIGSYNVTVASPGVPTPTSFALTNSKASITTTSVGWGTVGNAALFTSGDGLRLLPAGRNYDLPWVNIQKFTITLNGAASLTPGNVSAIGAKGGNYGPVTITGSGSTYTITLAKPISDADRVTITIGSASIATFTRRIDDLPGDVNDDGMVTGQDQVTVRNAFTGFGDVSVPLVFLDLDGDGVVNINDYNIAHKFNGKKLP